MIEFRNEWFLLIDSYKWFFKLWLWHLNDDVLQSTLMVIFVWDYVFHFLCFWWIAWFLLFLVYFLSSGAKLCMILDLLGEVGSVTGVDVARHRLAACRTMIQKYELGDHCRLLVADGTTFSVVPIRDHTDFKSCNFSGYYYVI